MGQIQLPTGQTIDLEEPGKVSDGYHTFDELYDHRCLLFIALMKAYPGLSWLSPAHHDGSAIDGWFVAGILLPGGMITYHLPDKFHDLAVDAGVKILHRAPEWDGHTSKDVLQRLEGWIRPWEGTPDEIVFKGNHDQSRFLR